MGTGAKSGKIGVSLFLRKTWAALLNIVVMAYLARVLSKSDFGLLSISATFISFIEVLGTGSVGEFLIFKNHDDPGKRNEIINSSFWLNFLIIAIIVTIVVLFAPSWARYYRNYKITYLVYILVAGIASQALSTVPMAMLRKDLNYKPIIKIQTITGTLSQLSQIALAFVGLGVYSLAIPTAIFPAIAGVYLLMIAKPKIRMNFGFEYWREIFSYTRYVIGSRLLSRFANDGDNLILGRTLGMALLGVYDISFRLANLLNKNLLPIITNVSMPVFARYNKHKSIVLRQYIYMVRQLSVFFTPLYFVMIIFAPLIIRTLYGNKWDDAILPLQILCVFALERSISSPTAGMYNAMGHPKVPFYFTLLFTPVFLGCIYFFSGKGLIIVCGAVTFLRVLAGMYHIYKVGQIIGLSMKGYFNTIKHILLPNLGLAIVYFSMLHFVHGVIMQFCLMILYIPTVFLISYLFYKKSLLKDYLIFCVLFPRFRQVFSVRRQLKLKNV